MNDNGGAAVATARWQKLRRRVSVTTTMIATRHVSIGGGKGGGGTAGGEVGDGSCRVPSEAYIGQRTMFRATSIEPLVTPPPLTKPEISAAVADALKAIAACAHQRGPSPLSACTRREIAAPKSADGPSSRHHVHRAIPTAPNPAFDRQSPKVLVMVRAHHEELAKASRG